MNGEVIKEFLVGLGFSIDEGGLKKFNDSVGKAALKVTALYASVRIAAAGIAYAISGVSESFEQLGYEYKIIASAIHKAIMLRQEMFKAYSAAGVNLVKVVQASVKLNLSITKTKYALEAIYKSTASKFFGLLTKQSDIFRQKLYQNMPKIIATLEKFIKIIFKAFEATAILGTRMWSILTTVYDFFVKLDKATDGWSTVILGVIAAWKLLNLSFLATPLGMLLAGLTALLALYDDFKTFQEGGESLFDWTNVIPVINAVTAAVVSLWEVLKAVGGVLGNLLLAFSNLFHSNIKGFFDSLASASEKLWETLEKVFELSGRLSQIGGAAFGAAKAFFGDDKTAGNVAANVQNNPASSPLANPVNTSNVSNAQSNQNVQQQTNINILGSADASSTGKAVASEQSKVNFDMVRNLKGATR